MSRCRHRRPSRSGFLVKVTAVLAGGSLLDGWILAVYGPISSTLQKYFQMDVLAVGLLASVTLIGIFFGAPIGGWASDKFGRRPVFIIDISLFLVASLMQFFVGTIGLLILVRFIMGLAIGAEYALGWSMLGEMSPAKHRGKLLGLHQASWYIGFMLGYTFSYFLNEAGVDWRWILGASTFIALALLLGRLGLPESPYWLWSQGRKDDARRVAHKYMLSGQEDLDELEQLENQKKEQKVDAPKVKLRDIFGPTLWRSTVFFTIFWVANVLPYFGIATFAEEIVAQYGLSGGIAGGIGINTLALVGVVVALALVDRIGRRPLAVAPLWIIFAVFVILTFWGQAIPSMLVLMLFFVFAFMNAAGGCLNGVYPPELFPVEVRGTTIGFSTSVSRIAAAVGTFIMPVGIEQWGMGVVMGIMAVVVLAGAVTTQLWAPETKGKTLAQLADAKVVEAK